MEGTSAKAIVIPATGDSLGVTPRNGDMSWKDFLSRAAGRYAANDPSMSLKINDSVQMLSFRENLNTHIAKQR